MEESAELLESAPEAEEKSVDTGSLSPAPIDASDDNPSDDEEIEHEGEKYRVPKKLKDSFLMQADYTRKTQEIANQRKELELKTQDIQRRSQEQQQYLNEVAEAISLDKQIAQFKGVDWNALIDRDPVEAMRLDRQMRELTEQRNQVVSGITHKQQQQAMESQQATVKQLQEASAMLTRDIPGWGPDMQRTIVEFGQENGYTPHELSVVVDPRAVKMLHKAMLYDQLTKKQAAIKSKPESQEKPVTKIVASRSTVRKDPAQMTDKEFAIFRRQQIKGRNR